MKVATRWIATIQYAYADPAKDARIRRWNPLGFKVIDFRPEAETLAQGSETGKATRALPAARSGAGVGS